MTLDPNRETAAQMIAEAQALRDEMQATRILLRDANAPLRRMDNNVAHIRQVVDGLDGLVKEAVLKLRSIKLPKWATAALGGFGEASTED